MAGWGPGGGGGAEDPSPAALLESGKLMQK